MAGERGPSTRVVHAGLPQPAPGEPFLPGPVFAAPFHLHGPVDSTRFSYQRHTNPTWEHLEAAVGELEGGEVLFFASGMAAVAAVVIDGLGAGDVLVAPSDAYPGIRAIAREHLEPRGVEVRLVPTDAAAVREAMAGATIVWVESPSNPGLDTLDLAALAGEAHAAGGGVRGRQHAGRPAAPAPARRGRGRLRRQRVEVADRAQRSRARYVAVRDPERATALRAWRSTTGAIPGPFEAWLAHRSLATLSVRLERQEANAAALADALRARDDVTDVRWPGLGSVLAFTVDGGDRAQAFFGALRIVAEATSFGGLHSSAERRARWGTDAVAEGWIRFSTGIEDTADLVADVLGALDATR